jgi:hypothetical protein
VEIGIVVSGSGDGAVVGSGRLLVGVVAVDWALVSWVAGGALGVCACWLHPHSDNPTRALAAAVWIFRSDFIFVIPFFRRAIAGDPHRRSLLGRGAVGAMISS